MALRETAHQYIFFILSQSHLVYIGLIGLLPRLSSFLGRYVSFPFHLPLCVSRVCLYFFFTHLFIGSGLLRALFLARVMSYWHIFWSTGFSQLVTIVQLCVYLEDILFCLVLLLLGLVSSESHRQVQLIRAELSSKSSSERLSESPSKLSSHQIPRCLGSGGPLQLKGCTRTSSMFSPTTPSGASVLSAFFSHSALHFDFGVEQACSAAARVPPRSPSPGAPLLHVLVLCLRYEASSHPEGCRRRIRVGSVFPSSSSTCSSLGSPTRGKDVFRGVRTCFPGAAAYVFKFVFL